MINIAAKIEAIAFFNYIVMIALNQTLYFIIRHRSIPSDCSTFSAIGAHALAILRDCLKA
jgi:hypothetical protein